MYGIECKACKGPISDFKTMVQIIDENGFTHTYCQQCGEKIKERLKARDDSIM